MSHRILVVDDSPIIRTIVRRSIGMSGLDVADVLEAGNGREALDVLAREAVDVVFADLNMPEMSGQELVDRMCEDSRLVSIPVVVVSSDRNEQRLAELRRRGIRAFVKKPFRPEQLRGVVEDLLATVAPADARPVPELPRAVVEETLAWTLGEAAFALLDRDEAPPDWPGVLVVGSLPFHGPAHGTVQLATSPEFAAELAANLLGLDPDDVTAARRAHEALGELLNIFAGALFAKWFGPGERCAMGIPRLRTVAAGAPAARPAEALAAVSMRNEEGHRIDACVLVESLRRAGTRGATQHASGETAR